MIGLRTVRYLLDASPLPLYRVVRNLEGFYRAGFVSTAASEGVLTLLSDGPRTTAQICEALALGEDHGPMESWLDLGVSLGELRKNATGYRIRGSLSRELSDPANGTALAFFQARVHVLNQFVLQTPALLREGKRLTPDPAHGELVARSSRTVEPLIFAIVDELVPRQGAMDLLEVGCGSGTYIRHACARNPDLRVVGLELTSQIAGFARENLAAGGLTERTSIHDTDVREFHAEESFDLVTMYNLIYYFPLAERTDLLRHLHSLVRPGGRLALATLTQARDASTLTMDLWSSMSEGGGPLPRADELKDRFTEAGFDQVVARKLLPNFWLYIATRAGLPARMDPP